MRRPRSFKFLRTLSRPASMLGLKALGAVLSLSLLVTQASAQNIGDLFNLGGSKPKVSESSPEVTFSLRPASQAASALLTATVKLKIPKGSHTYSTAEGFSGRTKFIVKSAEGLDAVDHDFVTANKPKVKDDPLLGQKVEIHETDVTWTRRFKIKVGVDPSDVRLIGEMRYQVCDATSCRPKRESFDLKLTHADPKAASFDFRYAPTRKSGGVEKPGPSAWTVRLSPENAQIGEKVTLSVTAKMADGFHTFALDQDRRNFGLPTVIQDATLSGLKPADSKVGFKPNHEVELHEFEGKEQRIHHGEITWTRSYLATDSEYGVAGKVTYQVCNANSCIPYGFEFELGTVSSAPPVSKPLARPAPGKETAATDVFGELKPRQAAASVEEDSGSNSQPGAAASFLPAGFGQYLFYAFVGGLILNVMPCVLPVIAIKVLSFVQQAGEDRGRILLLNVSYSAGVIAVFLGLATMAAFFQLSWGGQFQSVGFVICMIALVYIMGLSLLGVFEIPIPGFAGSAGGGQQEGLSGAFMTGIFATILATPCSGPFLGPTFGWSASQHPAVIYAVWTMMGLGMSAPYLLFGLFPAAVKFLPKPGNWMITFKQIAGFIMMGTTVFLLSVLKDEYVMPVLVLLLGLSVGTWMIGNLYSLASPASTRWRVRFLALMVVGAISTYSYHLATDEEKIEWQPFTPSAVQAALESGKPVMVDFTADWCLTCKVVERTTLDTDPTREVVDTHGIVTLKADWTDGSDEIRDLLNRLGGDSIPTLAVFSPARPKEPIVLRDAWTQSTLLEQLEAVVSENENNPGNQIAMAASR